MPDLGDRGTYTVKYEVDKTFYVIIHDVTVTVLTWMAYTTRFLADYNILHNHRYNVSLLDFTYPVYSYVAYVYIYRSKRKNIPLYRFPLLSTLVT